MKVLVTGANGLVGNKLCSFLEQDGTPVVRAVRKSITPGEAPVGEINESTDWSSILKSGVEVAVHLAAQVPLSGSDPELISAQYRQINTLGTANLARQCADKGVKRFVFVSTVKVLGEGRDQPYRSDDLAMPSDAYAISKWEAEQTLKQIAVETGMEVVILRPPLVYGPRVKGNFLRLLQAVDRRTLLPLGAIENRRSLIFLDNLIDAIHVCLKHPAAAGKTFMVSDGEDVSTPELIHRLATALGHTALLLPVPVTWMKWAAKMVGRQPSIDRLVGSLAVDIQPIQGELGWSPPYSLQSGLASTAEWYRKQESRL
jgi:nucleoside-diphosphate-sugar epimerase